MAQTTELLSTSRVPEKRVLAMGDCRAIIAKNLLTGSLKNRSIDNLETQKKSISMKNSQIL
jgi:hypothetical protein